MKKILILKQLLLVLVMIAVLGMVSCKEKGPLEKAGKAIEQAVIKLVAKDIKSLAAGKMGYSTTEVGDLIVKSL